MQYIGIIGWNQEAKTLAEAIIFEIKDVELLSIASTNDEALRFANEHNVKHIFDDFRDILELHQLDIITIFNSTNKHDVIVRNTLEADVDIFAELPFAYNVEQAQSLAESLKRYPSCNVAFFNDLNTHPVIKQAYKLVKADTIGKVKSISVTQKSIQKNISQQGIIADEIIHLVDLIHLLATANIKTVYATSDTTDIKEMNQVSIAGKLDNEANYLIDYEQNGDENKLSVRVVGSLDTMTFDIVEDTIQLRDSDVFIPSSSKISRVFTEYLEARKGFKKIHPDAERLKHNTLTAVAMMKSILLEQIEILEKS